MLAFLVIEIYLSLKGSRHSPPLTPLCHHSIYLPNHEFGIGVLTTSMKDKWGSG